MKCSHVLDESSRWARTCRLHAVVVRDDRGYCKRHDPVRMRHRGLKRARLMDMAFALFGACEQARIRHKSPETERAENLASDLLGAIPNDTEWIDELVADDEYTERESSTVKPDEGMKAAQ